MSDQFLENAQRLSTECEGLLRSVFFSLCCKVWKTNHYLTCHEKAVRTRCHKVSHTLKNTDWSRDDTQTGCKNFKIVYRKSTEDLSMYNVNTPPSDHTACAGWDDATNMFQKKTLDNSVGNRQPRQRT